MKSPSLPRQLIVPVQVEVQGIDSKAVKSTYTAFHTFRNGKTTLSCSGLLLQHHNSKQHQQHTPPQQQQALVLVPVTCIFPFLQQPYRSNLSNITNDNLLPGAQLTVLLRPQELATSTAAAAARSDQSENLLCLPAKLAGLLPLPHVAAAADQLLTSSNSSSSSSSIWKFGWYLADQQPVESATSSIMSHLAVLTVDLTPQQRQRQQQQQQQRITPSLQLHVTAAAAAAAAGIPSQQQQCHECMTGCQPGLQVAICGTPFGCLASEQFHGAVITGVISNIITNNLTLAGNILPHSTSSTPTSSSSVHSLGLSSAAAAEKVASISSAAAAAAARAARAVAPLLVVDGRCMPGMEGGAVACRCCHRLLGMLTLPLSNNSGAVELMLAITETQITAALAAAAAGPGSLQQIVQGYFDWSSSSSSSNSRVVMPGGCRTKLGSSSSSAVHVLQQQQCGGISRQLTYRVLPQQQQHWQQGDVISSMSSSTAAALAAAQGGVVMVRIGRSWGSGVIITSSGLVVTNAHIFGSGSSSSSTYASVRLSAPAGSSSSGVGNSWLPARLLYCYKGYLDLAVLQIDQKRLLPYSSSSSRAESSSGGHDGAAVHPWQQQQQQRVLQPLKLVDVDDDVRPGEEVYVIGHGLFGPGVTWPPAITGGCVARIVHVPPTAAAAAAAGKSPSSSSSSSERSSMLITTAAVHAGASGGALVNSAGKLVGLVTSNAKHARGATLPHCNFCISAAELRPLYKWAQQQQQQQQQWGLEASRSASSSSSSRAIGNDHPQNLIRQLQSLDRRDPAGIQLWALLQPTAVGKQQGSSTGTAAAVMTQLGRRVQDPTSLNSKL